MPPRPSSRMNSYSPQRGGVVPGALVAMPRLAGLRVGALPGSAGSSAGRVSAASSTSSVGRVGGRVGSELGSVTGWMPAGGRASGAGARRAMAGGARRRSALVVLARLGQAEQLQPRVQPATGDPQQLGGAGLVALGAGQRLLDQPALGVGQAEA